MNTSSEASTSFKESGPLRKEAGQEEGGASDQEMGPEGKKGTSEEGGGAKAFRLLELELVSFSSGSGRITGA